MKKYVQCKTENQWDIVSKKLGRTDPTKFNEAGDCIDLDNANSSSYYSHLIASTEKHEIISFEQWTELIDPIKKERMAETMLDVLNKTYNNLTLRRTTVPLFMSNPGTGKTSIIRNFAKNKGVKLVKITLSQRMPNEVVGMVMPDTATGKLVVYDSHELTSLNDGDILFFDEVFNGTLKQTLDAVLNLLEDRMLPSGNKLADVLVVAASNPQGLINLTPQIKERFIRYDLKFNKDEYQKILKEKYGMPLRISGHLCTIIAKEKFNHDGWNFTTPRSIEKAINQIGCDLISPYDEMLLPFLNEQLSAPMNITSLGVKKGDKVEYLKLLRLMLQGANKVVVKA